ncbi:hypothetical protein VQ042_20260 [Aurantimonas sp. A2-1-M11]|uniref:hypothetical protein n=1 Tax=Aurantimonas sp. A2-1-M11 TaxID=3113712 RepID=UPI002F9388A4
MRIPVSCDCDEPELIGVSIEGTAWADEPEMRVSFQLKIDVGGTDYRIARLDWRPRQPHVNKLGPPELRGRACMASIHDFPENAALGLEEMQLKNLPVAKPIDPEPSDFDALLRQLRDTFRLDNAIEIPVPPWSPQLF